MKLIVYLVFQDKVKKDTKVANWSKIGGFVHMFDTKERAVRALNGYVNFGEVPYAVVEAAIDFETLTEMASCAMTGNSWTIGDFEVLNVWNYGI